MAEVAFYLKNGYSKGEVVKTNHHTIWVRLPDGHIIKRHRRKHFVVWVRDNEKVIIPHPNIVIPVGGKVSKEQLELL